VSSNYPNPFNPSTKIDIQTVTQSNLNVSVFDAKGRLVNTLINKNKAPGFYSLKWDGVNSNGRNVPTGIYFIQVKSGENIDTQKVAFIK
jgi:flagellar hook assembly protein FlgD